MSRRVTRFLTLLVISLLGCATIGASSAAAEYVLEDFDVRFTDKDATPNLPFDDPMTTQAGSHPFAMTTSFGISHSEVGGKFELEGDAKDLILDQVAGFVGDPKATPHCTTAQFVVGGAAGPECPNESAVGITANYLAGPFRGDETSYQVSSVYNLDPPPGVVAKLGFSVLGVLVTLNVGVSEASPYNVRARLINIPQPLPFTGSVFQLWGDPADPAHDLLRGSCAEPVGGVGGPNLSSGSDKCGANIPDRPFITLPTNCDGAEATTYASDSWQEPGAFLPGGEPDLSDPAWDSGSVLTHDEATPPNPFGFTGCGKLVFSPSISAAPTTKAAESPTGLDFSLDVQDEGLTSGPGRAASQIRKTVVTLPEGFTVNPSIAEGLEVCTPAQLAKETAFSEAGAGCPNASKIGTVEVETPLLDENVNGSLFQAAPYDNPFGSLVALYVVIKNPTLGIKVVQPLNVIPDPVTGRLTTIAEDMPQLPFSHFKLHFREGARSPLASPPNCGTYNAEATLYPWAGGAPVTTTSAFQIISGPDAGPCPSGGLPPFKPGLIAGSINNAAGRFSPFNVRLFRTDSEQEITHFSIKLPPGITAKLAGVPYCSDAAIAAAKARTGPHGGQEELNSPSCPRASEIGHTLVGGGVGSALAYAPGKIYLAGPYNGSNLSIVAITAGMVGPFDIGTVVVREALKIDPETAEAFIDATGSDPIPHIVKGIPVHLRDIRAYVDRPNFVLNPTDCTRTSTASTVLGSGLDFGSEADDRPITVSTPYQAADCAALPFKPKLGLKLIGGTKRADPTPPSRPP